jgi:hypothetical protein
MIRLFTVSSSDGNMTDNETGLTSFLLTKPNVILDIVNVEKGTGDDPVIKLIKNGADTGRRFYAKAMDPSSAGRISVGPLGLGPGQYQFYCQHVGTAAAYKMAVKFAEAIE